MAGHFRNLAIPAAFGMLFSTLYNVVDVYWAGRLSTEAQAGLAIGFQALFVHITVGIGLGGGLSALISNALGRKDTDGAARLLAQGISFAVIACLLLMGIATFLGPFLITLVSEPGAYRDAGLGYFRWLIFALPGFLIAFGLNGVLQAHGDSRSMQRAMMVAFFANVGLNPLLIFGLPGLWSGMGFNGIALSTILSQTGVMLWLLSRVLRLEIARDLSLRALSPEPAQYRAILEQMAPPTTAFLVMIVSGFVTQFFLKGFGGEAIAAYGVALRIEQILLLPVLGMTGALLPIAGQNYGAEDHDRVREALWFCWKTGWIMCAIAAPILLFGGGLAMGLFTDDPEVIRIGTSYLRVDAFLFPVYMMLFAINSFLQALKRPIWTLWISIYRQGFGIIFFVWLFVSVLGAGVWGVWLGIACAVASGWVLALIVAARLARQLIGGLRG